MHGMQKPLPIGHRHGKLTIVEKVYVPGPTGRKRILYRCKCDCGGETIQRGRCVGRYSRGTISCGCAIKDGADKRSKYLPKEAAARQVWSEYYSDGCSFELFSELSQRDCFYCGSPPSNTSNVQRKESHRYADGFFQYNGLDRLDSSKDHNKNNIVTCCCMCNWMKRNHSVKTFLDHIEKIYHHQRVND